MSSEPPRAELTDPTLTEIEERYRQLAELSADAIMISQGGRIVYANPTAAQLIGAGSPSELLGKRVYDFVHPDHLPVAHERARRVVGGRTLSETVEARWIRLNGQVIDLEVMGMPIRFEGQPAAQIVIRDITLRKQAEAQLRESERRYRTIFETVGVAIWENDFTAVKAALDTLPWDKITDLRVYLHAHPEFVRQAISLVRVVDVNPAGLAMVGAQDERKLVASLSDIFLPETVEVLIEVLAALAEGGSWLQAETAIHSLQGDRIDVLVTIRLPGAGYLEESALISVTDITDRKQAEAAVTQALATAEHALRVREEFLSVATHELRTPITSVRTASQFVRRQFEQAGETLPQGLLRMARVMDEQTDKLGRMVDQLLDLSRLEAGRLVLDRRRVDLMPIIHGVADLGRALSSRHEIVVNGVPSLVVDVDPLRIEQVLVNLVGNAVKFSPRGGSITIGVSMPADATTEIAVSDPGIGVPEEHRERIFERFYQVEPSERATGMGLGLYICRQIVEMHGGRIWIDASATAGSCFVISLPIDGDPAQAEQKGVK
jgi:PAS domain S-box-containing protein